MTYRIFIKIGFIFIILGDTILGTNFVADTLLLGQKQRLLPPAGQILHPNKTNFCFAVVGDTGHNTRTFPFVHKQIKQDNPDFIIYIGDLVKYTTDKHMQYMANVLTDITPDTPIFFTPGNHDITLYHHGPLTYKPYINTFGQTYYWFGYGDTLFIALDSAKQSIDDTQWEFYKWTMKHIAPSFKHSILYTHVPPIQPNITEFNRKLDSQSIEQMAKALKHYKPDAIFAGHIHLYSDKTFQGVPIYTSPASGQHPRGDMSEMGYLRVNVSSAGIDVRPVYTYNLNHKSNFKAPNIRRLLSVIAHPLFYPTGIIMLVFGTMLAGIGLIIRPRH